MKDLKLSWQGVPTEDEYKKALEAQKSFAEIGLTLELIGKRPNDRG